MYVKSALAGVTLNSSSMLPPWGMLSMPDVVTVTLTSSSAPASDEDEHPPENRVVATSARSARDRVTRLFDCA